MRGSSPNSVIINFSPLIISAVPPCPLEIAAPPLQTHSGMALLTSAGSEEVMSGDLDAAVFGTRHPLITRDKPPDDTTGEAACTETSPCVCSCHTVCPVQMKSEMSSSLRTHSSPQICPRPAAATAPATWYVVMRMVIQSNENLCFDCSLSGAPEGWCSRRVGT